MADILRNHEIVGHGPEFQTSAYGMAVFRYWVVFPSEKIWVTGITFTTRGGGYSSLLVPGKTGSGGQTG